jgi:sarcosine/dimethylglycine N-methyltransferase
MTEQATVNRQYSGVVLTAQEYYNSSDADRFYATIWGGEDIHIGIYNTPDEPIFDASHRTVERMAQVLNTLNPDARVIDLGAGYGGSARYLAETYGCKVCCLNLSEAQNERNRRLNKERGLEHLIEVVDGSFEDIPYDDDMFTIVWSQDAFLHSGNRRRVLEETRRVLKKGGELIFTDPMQSDDCPPGVLQPILNRIQLDTLGSIGFYRETLKDLAFEEQQIIDMSEQLPTHYGRVRNELESRYDEITQVISQDYADRMIKGLGHWVEGGQKGYLSWGILYFRLL